jgi:23S rRNA (guanosine2251-2'-O)-methyltransferase
MKGTGRSARSDRSGGLGGEQVEGHHAVHELLAAGRRDVERLWVVGAHATSAGIAPLVELARRRGVPVLPKTAEELLWVAKTGAPQGVIAWAAPVVPVTLGPLLAPGPFERPQFLLVLDGVTDPGNFGSLLRSAACAGVGGVVVAQHRSAALTPAAVKAAAGAVEHVPISLVPGIPAALQQVTRAGIWVVGLDPAGKEDLWRTPLLDGPVALVLGSEGKGLSQLVRQRCDSLVRVAQSGPLASLNVAAAAAVACFEVARRRAGSAVPSSGS